MEERCERFIELLVPPSNVKLLCCIFRLHEEGIREFTEKDLQSKCKNLRNWSIHFSLYRLQQKGIIRCKYIFPLQNGGRVRIYELNEQNVIVQKLLELFRVVVRGGESRGNEHIRKICESQI